MGDIFEGRVTLRAELSELGDPADEAPGGVEVSRDREAELWPAFAATEGSPTATPIHDRG